MVFRAFLETQIRDIDRKLDTQSAKWSATQLQLNYCLKLEDQLKVVQKGVQETVDAFKSKVTTQFMELSDDFIKQVASLDTNLQQTQRDITENSIKVDSIREFTQGYDIRLEVLGAQIKDVRDNQDSTKFTYHFGERINNLEY